MFIRYFQSIESTCHFYTRKDRNLTKEKSVAVIQKKTAIHWFMCIFTSNIMCINVFHKIFHYLLYMLQIYSCFCDLLIFLFCIKSVKAVPLSNKLAITLIYYIAFMCIKFHLAKYYHIFHFVFALYN